MTDEELEELSNQRDIDEGTMHSGCTDYACYCHFKLPKLVTELRQQRERTKQLEKVVHDLVIECREHDSEYNYVTETDVMERAIELLGKS